MLVSYLSSDCVEGRQRRLAGARCGHVERVAVRDGSAHRATRADRYPPLRLAGVERIGVEPRRAEDDELCRASGRLEYHGRGPSFHSHRALLPPTLTAGLAIECDEKRAAALVAEQHHEIPCDDRRRRHAVEALERSQWQRPSVLAVGREGCQTEIGEEDNDAVIVCRGGWRRRVVRVIHLLRVCAPELPSPELAPRRGIERNRQKLVAFAGSQVHVSASDHRRRLPVGRRDFPDDVAGRREHDGIVCPRRDPRPVRPAELRPLGVGVGCACGKQARKQAGTHDGLNGNRETGDTRCTQPLRDRHGGRMVALQFDRARHF